MHDIELHHFSMNIPTINDGLYKNNGLYNEIRFHRPRFNRFWIVVSVGVSGRNPDFICILKALSDRVCKKSKHKIMCAMKV